MTDKDGVPGRPAFCHAHFQRYRRLGGNPKRWEIFKSTVRECDVNGCEAKAGYLERPYRELYRVKSQ